MELKEAVKALDEVFTGMKARFPKAYSSDRLEQLRSALLTARMAVEHLHDEEHREEHEDRQASQIRKMVLGSRDADSIPSISEDDARKRVEAGERV
jgi:hypothetical protein